MSMDPNDLNDITARLRELAAQLGDKPRSEYAPLLLALDQGGHASRALVFDIHGNQVAQAYAPIDTHHPGPEQVEHDAAAVLASLQQAVSDIADILGRDTDRLIAAGLATQRSSIVCWDRITGQPLSPVLSWQDRRNMGLIAELYPQRAEIQSLTGLVLSPHYGASKLRWCLEHLDAVKRAQEQQRLHAGPLSSFLLRGLLNEHPHVVDPANASRTLLWSPATRDWHEQLLHWFGVPRDVLPQCVASVHEYGTLRVGESTVPLKVCTGDQAAVPFAAGALQQGCLYINLGTGAFLLLPVEHDLPNVAPLLRSVLWSDHEHTRYALEGTVNGAGSALAWFTPRSGIDVERALPNLQAGVLDAADTPLFINGIGGVGSPFWRPQLEPRFVTAQGEHIDPLRFARVELLLAALVESIAFLIHANLEQMRTHATISSVMLGGGLSHQRYLCECIAALSGLSLTRLKDTELTGRGLAYLLTLASHSDGQWPACDAAEQVAATHRPALQARYVQWREWMQTDAG